MLYWCCPNWAGYLAALTDFLSRPACLFFTAMIKLLCPNWLVLNFHKNSATAMMDNLKLMATIETKNSFH